MMNPLLGLLFFAILVGGTVALSALFAIIGAVASNIGMVEPKPPVGRRR